MNKINLKEVEKMANYLNNDKDETRKELRNISSLKSRLQKQKYKSTYATEMTNLLKREQIVKEVRSLLNPKVKKVTEYTEQDVIKLTYEQCVKAIKSIQSKKTLTKWLTREEGNNDEFRRACKIEELIKLQRSKLVPLEATVVSKLDVQKIIDELLSNSIKQERVVELLQKLM